MPDMTKNKESLRQFCSECGSKRQWWNYWEDEIRCHNKNCKLYGIKVK